MILAKCWTSIWAVANTSDINIWWAKGDLPVKTAVLTSPKALTGLPNQKTFMYFVYLIECSDGSLYTGITTDVERRFQEHKHKEGGHYTSSKKVVRVAYTEQHPDRSSASKREAQIKSWTRQKKLDLIKTAPHIG